jgi:hypothetical protein
MVRALEVAGDRDPVLELLVVLFSVKMSHKVCVGCSWAPSPPLITGRGRVGGQTRGAVARVADQHDVRIIGNDAPNYRLRPSLR